MPRMKTHYDRINGFVVLGPCPGCDIWTLQYDTSLANTYSLPEFSALIEELLLGHLQECSGLREIVDTLN